MQKIRERWNAFGAVLIDPWVIILLASTIYLSLQLLSQEDKFALALLTVLVSLLSSTLGGIVAKRWDDLTEEKVIVTRAKSAHRSLELILSSIIALEKRVKLFVVRHNNEKSKKAITTEVIKTYFEEVLEDCVGLEERVINSMEDWKDILPNLEVRTTLNLITELNGKYSDALIKLETINNSLEETKDKSKEEITKLTNERNKLAAEVVKIQTELRQKSIETGIRNVSDSLITGGVTAISLLSQYLSENKNKPLIIEGHEELDDEALLGAETLAKIDKAANKETGTEKGKSKDKHNR